MGMYDTIRFYGDAAPRCAAGHRVADLQTKDLDCALEVYSIYGDRLYRPGEDNTESARLDESGRLLLTETRVAEAASVSIKLRAYSQCMECRPVLYLGEGTLRGDYVHERRPWCEWGFVFRDGRLERCEAVRVESREAVAEALRREGREVLDDDERLLSSRTIPWLRLHRCSNRPSLPRSALQAVPCRSEQTWCVLPGF